MSIGVIDSGVGGLSVLRHLQAQLSHESWLYVADQAHVPYGGRPLTQIRQFSRAITQFLLAQQVKLIVVACNTASGAALTYLRQTFPHVPFVGIEPAVKPAAAQTRSGKVGVLATTGTFESQRYAGLMARFTQDVVTLENPCLGLVERIEAGETAVPATEALLRACVEPMLAAGVDTLVLGCTHYPFVLPLLSKIAGPQVTIIDPAPAVARQTGRVLAARGLAAKTGGGQTRLVTTGSPAVFGRQAAKLLGHSWLVEAAVWRDDQVSMSNEQ